MSLHVFAPNLTPTAKQLITLLGAKRLSRYDGMHFLRRGVPIEFSPTDAIVCWGLNIPPIQNTRIINNSFEYPTQVSINTTLAKLILKGISAVNAVEANKQMYESLLFEEWPKSKPGLFSKVALAELPYYVTPYYNYKTHTDVFVFKGKALFGGNAATADLAVKALEHYGLDFGMVTIGLLDKQNVIYKIITNPELSEPNVALLAARIREWYQQE